jgi:hypothetical protein
MPTAYISTQTVTASLVRPLPKSFHQSALKRISPGLEHEVQVGSLRCDLLDDRVQCAGDHRPDRIEYEASVLRRS